MNKSASRLAASLLDAHVEFLLEQLQGAALGAQIDEWIDAVLAQAGDLALESLVGRELVQATARRFAVELEPGGGIPELVGDIARALHAHPVHGQTRLGDLLTPRRFEDLLGHLLDLRSVRRRLVEELIRSPLYERMASELLYNGIRDYLARSAVPAAIPGARSAMKLGRAVVSRATPLLEGAVEDGLKRHIGRSVREVSEKSLRRFIDGEHDAELRELAIDSWQRIRDARVGDVRADLSALDVEELFVTLYEWWRELRHTPFIDAMIAAGVDGFFDKYGQATLDELLADFGIDRAMMRTEAQRFLPPVLERLRAAGRLAPLLRRMLAPFYASEAIGRVLAAGRTRR